MAWVTLLDGLRRVPADTPVLRADDLGVLRGEAVFETCRIVGGRAAHLDAHLARMATSASRVDLTLPPGWEELAAAACAGVDEGVLRLVCTKGPPPTGYALVTPIPDETVRGRQEGVHVVTLTLGVTAAQRQEAPWLLGGVKSTSYAVNMATQRQAYDLGADDAIWLSSDGWVLEAPTSNVVVVLAGELVSPPIATGVLPGTTLAAVRALHPVRERPVSAADLEAADEVMLLSSIRGVAPVLSVDGRQLGPGPATLRLRDAFEASLLTL